MNEKEIKKEYINFLKDTKKENNIKAWEEFKSEFISWYIELFGIEDGRTQLIIEDMNDIKFKKIKNV